MCIEFEIHTHEEPIIMRTNIDIDDALLARALEVSGLRTKRAAVEEGLKLLLRVREQAQALKDLKGLGWEGDLDDMRLDRRESQP